jgi:hypothetical protein
MKRRTPQEKKQLSYEKDRRSSYGANDKASRKGVPRRRAKASRSYRKLTKQQLPGRGETVDRLGDVDEVESSIGAVRRNWWRKWPDRPLREHVAIRLRRRSPRNASSPEQESKK